MKVYFLSILTLLLTILSCEASKKESEDYKKFPYSWKGQRQIWVSDSVSHDYGLATNFILEGDSVTEFHYPFKYLDKWALHFKDDSIIKYSDIDLRKPLKCNYRDNVLTVNYVDTTFDGKTVEYTETYAPMIFNQDSLNEILTYGFPYTEFMRKEWFFIEEATKAVNKDSLNIQYYNLPLQFIPNESNFEWIDRRKLKVKNDTFFLTHYLGSFMSLELLNCSPRQFFLFQDSSQVQIMN